MTPWFPYGQRAANARLRLFCLPYAGGAAGIYRKWMPLFPGDIEIRPVELPGRGLRFQERLFTAMPEAVTALAAAMEPLLDRPFAIFGHSLGALMGYELVHQLTQSTGQCPVHLFVSACTPPHVPPVERLHDLPESLLLSELFRMNGTPRQVLEDAGMRRILLPVIRADLSMYENYVDGRGSPLACPITAISGRDDPRAAPGLMSEWRRHTCAAFALHPFWGDHFFLHTSAPRIVELIAQTLRTEAQASD